MTHVAVVLAAGQGTRMKSTLPKVLHPVAGRSMLAWVLAAVAETGPERTVVVVGHGAEHVIADLPDAVEHCLQAERLGTGHAASVALEHFGPLAPGTGVLVVPGDTPLVDGETLSRLVDAHVTTNVDIAMLTTRVADPTGYGRVLRDDDGRVTAIIEHADADETQRAVDEVNAGMYVFAGETMAADLASLRPENAQGEYYLTDLVHLAEGRGGAIDGVLAAESVVAGVNDHRQLAAAGQELRNRINAGWMAAGVRMIDPTAVWIGADVEVAPGAVLYPGVHLEGATSIGAGAAIGPDVHISDSSIGPDSRLWYSVARGADIGAGCEVGPYASLRPGTVLRDGSKLGTFVETKNTTVGEGSKVPHLSYMGDATIGRNSNIGAGTITCNYDGFAKYPTTIGDDVKIGSDTMLVAPVTIGDGAMTGAGSVISRDVEPGALGIARAKQTAIPGFVARMAERYRAKRREGDDTE